MIWPFNHFSQSHTPSRRTIETIYGMIVAQAREPLFYSEWGVPDTVNGRFEMIVLHLWMVLRRTQGNKDMAPYAQALFDHFCSDLDANLREMGIGDLAVPKRMQKFGEAFYGRAAAYDRALEEGHEAFSKALCRNILNGFGLENGRKLADYAEHGNTGLGAMSDAQLLKGELWFPTPKATPAA
jgi:cytochrome b pre-mRNA-processing protein 3